MKPAMRLFWRRQVYQWHWISAAISLAGILAFAMTGITLNHAQDIPAARDVTAREATLPQALVERAAIAMPVSGKGPLPDFLREELSGSYDMPVSGADAEWMGSEIYLDMPRPGGEAWFSLDLTTGEAVYESTSRGWVAFFNDLHKGRNAGAVWAWFLDIFAAACIVFSVTGFFLLQLQAKRRPATWPVAAAGVAVPFLLIVFFVHG